MKNISIYLLKIITFWIFFFASTRLVFLLLQIGFGKSTFHPESVFASVIGFRMDLSMAFYFIAPVLLTLLINHFFKSEKIQAFIKYFNLLLLLICCIIIGVDAELYQDWGYRMDYTPLTYLTVPGEAANFLTYKMVLVFSIAAATSLGIGYFLFNYFFQKVSIIYSWSSFFGLILWAAIWIIPIRGGIGEFPLNPGQMYYSKKVFHNHLAINPVWNVVYTSIQKQKIKSNYEYMPDQEAKGKFSNLISVNTKAKQRWLKSDTPNILIIILETFTAEVNHKKYKDIEIMPRLNKIFEDGIYFPNAYGCGDRTDKGVVSVLSGYPAQPQSSIMMYQKKSESLPSIIKSLKTKNYNSTFYYGGELNFASMKSYIWSAGFEKIIDKNNFDPATYNAKWGVHDHILFNKAFQEIKTTTSPFVHCILSLSSHPPYDVPMQDVWKGNDEETRFINSIHYADRSLGALIDSLKKSPVWENLLVVLVGDHGGRFPGNMALYDPKKFHITMHFTGGAIRTDSIINRLSSQQDISKTILNQLDIPTEDLAFSQDLFSEDYKPFVYYAYNPGVGCIDSSGRLVYSLETKNILETEGNPTTTLDKLLSYLQLVMRDFNNR